MFPAPRLTAVLCAPLFFIAFYAEGNATLIAEGTAYELKSKKVAYIERHFRKGESAYTITYHEPGGDEFARKVLDFSGGPTIPLFEQVNLRIGEEIKISKLNEKKFEIYYKESNRSKARIRKISITNKLVVDAGFDNFVRAHWNDLTQGNALSFNYLLPSWGKTTQLSIKKLDSTPDFLYLEIVPKNVLLDFLSDGIKLTYDLNSRKLTHFSGKGNIATASGKYQNVSISYQYFDNNPVGTTQ